MATCSQLRLASTCLATWIAAAGCGEPMVDRPDAMVPEPPPAPTLDALPASAPYSVIILRGTAPGAQRVIVTGGPFVAAANVAPDGTFCAEVPVQSAREYALDARSVSGAGLLSPVLGTTTAYDPSAPTIPGLLRCDGSAPGACTGDPEDCGASGDEDCDRMADAMDPDCYECTDDVLEPNDDALGPNRTPGRYEALQLCSGNDDYHPVMVPAGQHLTARIFFADDVGDLDMLVYAPDQTTVIGIGSTPADNEALTITTASTGRHIVRVVGIGGAENAYSMALDVF